MDKKKKDLISFQQFDQIKNLYADHNLNYTKRNSFEKSETDNSMQQICLDNFNIKSRTSTWDRRIYENGRKYSESSIRSLTIEHSSTQSVNTSIKETKLKTRSDDEIIKKNILKNWWRSSIKSKPSPQSQRPTVNQNTDNIYTNSVGYQSPYTKRIFPILPNANGTTKNPLTEVEPNLILREIYTPKKNITSNKSQKMGPAKFYIMNFRKFDKIDEQILKVREASEKDVRDLEKTFKYLKMTGKIYQDLKLKELENVMEKISKKDFSQNTAIVIVIMSHGDTSSKLYAKNGSFKLHPTVVDKLFKNEHLCKKPKIIIVEACKGQKDPRWELDTNSSGAGTLIFYAAFENHVSYSDKLNGSYFTQSLCQNLQKMGKTEDISVICNAVIKDVHAKSGGIQTPTMECNLATEYCFGTYC